jgi:hypothetical protein
MHDGLEEPLILVVHLHYRCGAYWLQRPSRIAISLRIGSISGARRYVLTTLPTDCLLAVAVR